MSEPPREARWEVGETGVGSRGVVLQRDIVRQRALGASAWSGHQTAEEGTRAKTCRASRGKGKEGGNEEGSVAKEGRVSGTKGARWGESGRILYLNS